MGQFKAETLTAVHIGSGNKLLKNLDFFVYKQNNENRLGILDFNKIANIIGSDNIPEWINFIDKRNEKNIYDFISAHAQKEFEYKDIIKRDLEVYGDFEKTTELKEQLVNADNNPIIPGSSLKGAIRTAIATNLFIKNTQVVNSCISEIKQASDNGKIYGLKKIENKLMKKLFTGNQNGTAHEDAMRFLIVGDIEFAYETQGTVIDIINYYNKGWGIKKGQSAIVETIAAGCESEPFRIKINKQLLNENKNRKLINCDITYLSDIKTIFNIVNEHTHKMVTEEIDFWEKQENYEDIGNIIDKYLQKLYEISENINNLKENEMIIRIGGNTGWISITGGWIRDLLDSDSWSKLFHLLNKNRSVDIFPKTRKSDKLGEIFGFIKISAI